jgi:hypothetical protein
VRTLCAGGYFVDESDQPSCLESTARVFGEASQHQLPNRFGDHLNRRNVVRVLSRELGGLIRIKRWRAG